MPDNNRCGWQSRLRRPRPPGRCQRRQWRHHLITSCYVDTPNSQGITIVAEVPEGQSGTNVPVHYRPDICAILRIAPVGQSAPEVLTGTLATLPLKCPSVEQDSVRRRQRPGRQTLKIGMDTRSLRRVVLNVQPDFVHRTDVEGLVQSYVGLVGIDQDNITVDEIVAPGTDVFKLAGSNTVLPAADAERVRSAPSPPARSRPPECRAPLPPP